MGPFPKIEFLMLVFRRRVAFEKSSANGGRQFVILRIRNIFERQVVRIGEVPTKQNYSPVTLW
jgi:hypothetical protein